MIQTYAEFNGVHCGINLQKLFRVSNVTDCHCSQIVTIFYFWVQYIHLYLKNLYRGVILVRADSCMATLKMFCSRYYDIKVGGGAEAVKGSRVAVRL